MSLANIFKNLYKEQIWIFCLLLLRFFVVKLWMTLVDDTIQCPRSLWPEGGVTCISCKFGHHRIAKDSLVGFTSAVYWVSIFISQTNVGPWTIKPLPNCLSWAQLCGALLSKNGFDYVSQVRNKKQNDKSHMWFVWNWIPVAVSAHALSSCIVCLVKFTWVLIQYEF